MRLHQGDEKMRRCKRRSRYSKMCGKNPKKDTRGEKKNGRRKKPRIKQGEGWKGPCRPRLAATEESEADPIVVRRERGKGQTKRTATKKACLEGNQQ